VTDGRTLKIFKGENPHQERRKKNEKISEIDQHRSGFVYGMQQHVFRVYG
jgi:hypothetical protein